MLTTRPSGLLHNPARHKVNPGSFNTRPSAVTTWLDELPMGNSDECARRLLLALKEIHTLDISSKTRRAILSAFQQPVHQISLVLERYYANQSLPLSIKNHQMAMLARQLQVEMATGYHILIEHHWSKKLSFLTAKSMAQSIQHALYYLNKALLIGYEIYTEHPRNTWIHLHQLYLYAEDNNLHHSQISGPAARGVIAPHSIEVIYKQTLLLGLVSPFRLQQAETKKVHHALLEWSNLCKILPAKRFSGNSHQILLLLNNDYVPGYHFLNTSINHSAARTIDNSALVQHIGEQLVAKRSIDKCLEDEIAYDVLKLLLITWSGKSKRLFSRTPQKNCLCASIGLSATHFTLSQLQRSTAANGTFETIIKSIVNEKSVNINELDRGAEPTFDTCAKFNSPALLGVAMLNPVKPDVWDNTFNTTNNTTNQVDNYHYKLKETTRDATDFVNYRSLNLENINESAGGYCLLGYTENNSTQPRVQIGELIGLRDLSDDNDITLSIGLVTRLKSQNDGLQLGIQKLAPNADAVATCLYHKRQMQQKYDRSLLLPGIKSTSQAATLVLKSLYKENDDLVVDKHGYKIRVKLSKLVAATGNFNRFEFEIVRVIGIEPNLEPSAQHNTQDPDANWMII